MEKKELMKYIGNNVRRYRMERKMTQEELAGKVNRNASAITRIEGGNRMMSIPMLIAVADALDVSTDALLRSTQRPAQMSNISKLLSGQTENSLAHIEKIVQTVISEYGERADSAESGSEPGLCSGK